MSKLLLNHSPLLNKVQKCISATIYQNITLKRTHTYLTNVKNNLNNINQQIRLSSSGVVQSPLGNVKISNENMVEYIWKDSENWIDKPAAVSIQ